MEDIIEVPPTDIRDLGNNYVNAFVTFIDILGFKDIIKNKDPKIINSLLDAIKGFSSLPQRRKPPYNQIEYLPIVTQFSDSIVRIQPIINSEDKTDEIDILEFFYEEISSLTIAQGNLACNSILVRGGMTYGEICVHNNRIFGPAFNRAYYIESKLAKYPRIIIDGFLCTNTKNVVADESKYDWLDFTEQLYEYVQRVDDGLWCLDYLPIIYDAKHSLDIKNEDVLVAHRNAIKFLLDDALKKNDENILMKIRWLINYHNRIINRSFRKTNERYENNKDSLILDLD